MLHTASAGDAANNLNCKQYLLQGIPEVKALCSLERSGTDYCVTRRHNAEEMSPQKITYLISFSSEGTIEKILADIFGSKILVLLPCLIHGLNSINVDLREKEFSL
jgi:hypothetical protein